MSPELVGILCLIALITLILIGLPIGFAMALTGIVGFWIIAGWHPTSSVVGLIPWNKVARYSFTVMPLFIFMGNISFQSNFGRDIFETGRKWVGHLPGGISQTTVMAAAAFAAACGSSTASTVTFAKIAVPEMRRMGYDPGLATASVAASGTMSTRTSVR